MRKRSLLLVAGLVIVGSVLNAQQAGNVGLLHRGASYVPSLALSDPHAFPFGNSVAWMEPVPNDFLPSWRPDNWDRNLNLADTERRPYFAAPGGYSKDSKDIESSGASVAVQRNLFDYVHGEIGFFYGHSSGGRNSASDVGTYFNATTGNDKFQLTVGGFYENTNFDLRRGR